MVLTILNEPHVWFIEWLFVQEEVNVTITLFWKVGKSKFTKKVDIKVLTCKNIFMPNLVASSDPKV